MFSSANYLGGLAGKANLPNDGTIAFLAVEKIERGICLYSKQRRGMLPICLFEPCQSFLTVTELGMEEDQTVRGYVLRRRFGFSIA